MQTDLPPDPPGAAGAPRDGLLFWGVATAGFIALVLLVCGGVAFYGLRREVLRLSSAEKVSLPEPAADPAAYEALQTRLEAFAAPPAAGERREIVLAAGDLNTLLAGNPETGGLARHVHFRAGGDRVLMDVALPLRSLPLLGDRYLNATFRFRVAMENGPPLHLAVESGETRDGKKIPEWFLRLLGEYLTRESEKHLGALTDRATHVSVSDGRVHVRRVPPQPAGAR